MQEEFLELIEILLSQQLSEYINQDKEALRAVVNRFNSVCRNSRTSRFEFMSQLPSGDAIGPVPFSCAKTPFKLVFLSLNPKYEGDETGTPQEWFEAGPRWISHADYLSNPDVNRSELHSFKRVSSSFGRFYRNITVVLASLKERKFVKWIDYSTGKSDTEKQQGFLDLVEEIPLCTAEFIPFHSNNYRGQRLDKLFTEIPAFKNYLVRLIEVIDENTAPGGVIVCNGSGPTAAFRALKKISLSSHTDPSFEWGIWNNRLVLLLPGPILGMGGEFRSYSKTEKLLQFIFDFLSDFEQGRSV